jgi:hypothetical protein
MRIEGEGEDLMSDMIAVDENRWERQELMSKVKVEMRTGGRKGYIMSDVKVRDEDQRPG